MSIWLSHGKVLEMQASPRWRIRKMAPYLQAMGVVLLALAGVFAGRFFSYLGKRYQVLGYVLAASLIITAAVARYWWFLGLVPGLSLLTAGRREFGVMAFACTMLLSAVIKRLPHRVEKDLVGILAGWVVVSFCLPPFVRPAFLQASLSSIKTRLDSDGICHQNTAYTRGPAASVTALKRLGVKADEGNIALAAHSSDRWGTETDSLCIAITELYGKEGVSCEYRTYNAISELRDEGIPIALVKFAYLIDHYVTVLEVTDKEVVLGDPLDGKRTLKHEQFMRIWRRHGIVLKRGNSGSLHV